MTIDWLKRLAATLLSALLALPVHGVQAWAASLNSEDSEPAALESVDVSADAVSIRMFGEAKYSSFTTATPPRLVVVFENTEYQAGAKTLGGKGKYLKSVRSGQFQREPLVTRVVLDLNEMAPYKVTKVGDRIIVQLGTGGDSPSAVAAAAPKPKVAPKPRPAAVAPPPSPAEEPEAEPESDYAAAAATENPLAKVGETGGMTTEHSPELAAIAEKGDAARPDGEPPREVSSIASVGKRRVARSDIMSRLPRDLVTLDFDSTDIRDIIKLLASKAKVNIIYGPDVGGTLSLHLSDVPFADAFRTILTMMNLSTTQVGDNILRVLTPAALAKAQTASASSTKVIPLNYAKAAEILAAINAVRVAEGRSGTTISDTKTNSLIVTESIEGLLATERLIASLDVRPKQVLIEAKLVEVGLTNSLNYGIQWDYMGSEQGRMGGKQGHNLIGSLTSPSASGSPTLNPIDQNTNGVTGTGAAGRGTGVALPASTVFGALTLGRITNNYFVSATLTAAAAQGKVKVLSDPKIATLNNQPANINVTTAIPYVTSNVASTGVQTQSVSYVTTGIQLSVTPSINADGRITLEINPSVSQPSATAAASTTGAPAVDSRNAKTTVLVRDGETVVIGGLISDSVSNQIAKVPILGDIPILGWLFKKKSVTRTRAELLIFVTPKIMAD